jgi:hypothetical protein
LKNLLKLERIMIFGGFWKEAFEIGSLRALDLNPYDENEIDLDIEKSHEYFQKICKLYLEGLDNLSIILDAGFLKSAGEKEIIGPKSPDEMVSILEGMNWKEKRYHLWYNDFIELVKDTLGVMNDSVAFRIFTDFLAATSVQTKPGHNFNLTMEYLHKFIQSGSRSDFQEYLKLLAPSGEPTTEERSMAKRKRLEMAGMSESYLRPGETFLGHGIKEVDLNLARVMRGEGIVGPKVGPFAEGLRGNPNVSPTDRHIARILLGKDSPQSPRDFSDARRIMEEISAKTGLPILQVQSGIWCANLILTNKPIESYNEIVISRKRELTNLLSESEDIFNRT